jgi:polyhydroxyalkanoate synthesis repressor PhaR
MMAQPTELKIRKYSNRRFYDTTRSRHVTLPEMHELILAGRELNVTDNRTGEDITHQVLTQILLERDAPKLCMFPANILHQMIRTQQQFLGSVVEQFFQQALATHRASQERWTQFLQNVLGGPAPAANPLDWTRAWLQTFTPGAATGNAPVPPPATTRDDESTSTADVQELRRQIDTLSQRVEALQARRRTR